MGKRQTKERLVKDDEKPTTEALVSSKWKIEITEKAQAALEAIKDARVQKKLVAAIDDLGVEPDRKGKALVGELQGFRSVRVVGQRYRIIYALRHNVVTVTIVYLGMRKDGDKKDVYYLAKRLLNLLE